MFKWLESPVDCMQLSAFFKVSGFSKSFQKIPCKRLFSDPRSVVSSGGLRGNLIFPSPLFVMSKISFLVLVSIILERKGFDL